MKKIIILLLVICSIFIFVSCGKSDGNDVTVEQIKSCLLNIESITEVEHVTEENDPNGKLGKQGGYIICVYFLDNDIDQSQFGKDKTVVDKGTSCGGCIEVYENEDEAKQRDSYLATFDGTMLSAGSHKLLNTFIIRISDKLTATKQKELENKIIDQLNQLR